jgi:hypothetical protein
MTTRALDPPRTRLFDAPLLLDESTAVTAGVAEVAHIVVETAE